FASEIKAIIEDETVKRELNEQGFYDYFTFLTVPAPNTLFGNIYKLKPGHYIKIENGKVSEQTEYSDIYDNVEYHGNKTQERIQEELIDLLRTSVKYRLEADVPVGVFLSGGVI
ncbi:MAG TPA: asparagine synthase-related protein, partial [Bacteroidia bacterium]|nr:asparagine synthase-related protein [Bacteroidia bacterium]